MSRLGSASWRVFELAGRLVPGRFGPVVVLVLTDVLVLRNVLLSASPPAWGDAGFLYSELSFLDQHHLHIFSVWLPDPFGQVQQFSIYWLLAAIEGVIQSPLIVYKLVALGLLGTASLTAYGLALWLTNSRLAATVSGWLYALAPASMMALLLGHMDVAASYALGPALIWCLLAALRDGRREAMLALGLVGAALFLLTTGQAAYWVLPVGGLTVAELIHPKLVGDRLALVRRGLLTAVLAAAAFLVAAAVQVLPYLVGLRAPYAAGGTSYYIEQLSVHAKYSEPLIEAMIGRPQGAEFLNPGSSPALASFHSLAFGLIALVLVAIGLCALMTKRARAALPLAVTMVAAWLLATGPTGPIRPIYLLLYYHVPYFKLLRAPARWTIVSTFAGAMLVGLTIAELQAAEWRSGHHNHAVWARRLALLAATLGALMAASALVNGLPVWQVPREYPAAYGALRSDASDWRILTTPFYQEWMASPSDFAVDEVADTGQISRLWTGRAPVGRGGWDPRASQFVDYLYEQTERGTTRALTKLLGAAGVRYVALDPTPANEVRGPQNGFFAAQVGLVPVKRAGQVEILRNRYALPQAFVVRRFCVVAGGLGVLGDLAGQRWFSFNRLGLVFADQLSTIGGRPMLDRWLRRASCLIVGPGGRAELSVLLNAVATRQASALAPAGWSRSSPSPSLDVQADPSTQVQVSPGGWLSTDISVARPGLYRLAVLALRSPASSPLDVQLDGRTLPSVKLAVPAGMGLRWTNSVAVDLRKGSHLFRVAAVRRGQGAELIELALMPARLAWQPIASRVITERGGLGPVTQVATRNASEVAWPWRVSTQRGAVTARRGTGRSNVTVRTDRSRRQYYTLAVARAHGPINPWDPLTLSFRGADSGQKFFLVVDFDHADNRQTWFSFRDNSRRSRTLVFMPQQPDSSDTVPSWNSVIDFRLSTDSKARLPGSISIGPLAQSMTSSLAPAFVPRSTVRRVMASTSPADIALDPPSQSISTSAHLRPALGPGLLVFTQAFHPDWQLSRSPSAQNHSVALGFANAYDVGHLKGTASLSFTGARYGQVGFWISLAGWCALTVAVLILGVRRRRTCQ